MSPKDLQAIQIAHKFLNTEERFFEEDGYLAEPETIGFFEGFEFTFSFGTDVNPYSAYIQRSDGWHNDGESENQPSMYDAILGAFKSFQKEYCECTGNIADCEIYQLKNIAKIAKVTKKVIKQLKALK